MLNLTSTRPVAAESILPLTLRPVRERLTAASFRAGTARAGGVGVATGVSGDPPCGGLAGSLIAVSADSTQPDTLPRASVARTRKR